MRICFLLLAAWLVSACQAPLQSGSQCVVEPEYFGHIDTVVWRGENRGFDLQDETGYVSPIVADLLRQAVVAELANKGFRVVDQADGDHAELSVVLRTRRELSSIETTPSPCVDVDCWERIETGGGTRMDIRTIGFLAADIYHRGQPVWRGWVETNLYPKDRDKAGAVIERALPELFKSFPP